MRRVYKTCGLLLLASAASATVYLHESFNNGVGSWVQSKHKSDYGEVALSSGIFHGDAEINKGLKLAQDARFYATSVALSEKLSNEGKTTVVSLAVKHEQGLDCGGGYIKVLAELDQTAFHGESPYWLMFGPDKCGHTNKVHVIFNYNGKNLLWKKEPGYPDDKLTHVYTLVVKPDNTYEMYIDQEKKESGSLADDWAFLEPKMIDDPSEKKPEDWVDEAMIDDPEDKKPEDWGKEPEKIPDTNAKKPEDWDDEEDGTWEAPEIPNPAFQGEWRPKRIPNPAYKGEWKAQQIANPDYKPDDKLYLTQKPLGAVGIDVWQVKSGTVFDNIIIGDDLDEVNAIIDKTWKATKDAEKAAHDIMEKEAAKEAEKAEPAEESGKEDDGEKSGDSGEKEEL